MGAIETGQVLDDVYYERKRQDVKWGEQNPPDGTGPDICPLALTDANLDLRTGAELERIFKAECQRVYQEGHGSWKDILLEEVFGALAEEDLIKLRVELIQSAAVIVAWVESIDRRRVRVCQYPDCHRDDAHSHNGWTP